MCQEVDPSVGNVPIQSKSHISLAFPFGFYFYVYTVVVLHNINQVFSVFLPHIFDAKVVNYEKK